MLTIMEICIMGIEVHDVDEKLIRKMIEKCFRQYRHESDELPLNEQDYKILCRKIAEMKANEPGADLHDIINDAVYEYLTN
ncbi:YqzH family protein [Bacillus sp. T33-2]|uniref:YqzH family protein n=1 Tax=Bacillus sp. T33-2 TaxID=2054168 RepID=UPI000C76562A|nr:YqzH family protein [Bacillus sp. T33-2]PLR99834.1 hypothetical protein CVD19_01900 [Bacillus sp. T33-2]